MRVRTSHRPRRVSIWAALFFAVARVLVMVGTVPLTGLGPIVAEVVSGEFAPDPCGDCSGDERGGCDCPAGCPTCHCAQAGVPTLPPADAWELHKLPEIDVAMRTPYEADAPRSPPPRSVYRPPRAA